MPLTAGDALPTTPAPASVPLRERKKQATYVALRRSALALVAERGLAAVTVEDIAADANVSPRTFFNYFASKEDAVSGWDPSVAVHLVDLLRRRPAEEDAPVALRASMLEALASFDADHRDLLEWLRVTRSDPHLLAHHVAQWAETERRLVAALAERRGTGAAGDHYAALVVAVMVAAVRVAMMSWCEQEGQASLVEELTRHLDVLKAGLLEPERGLA